MKEVFINDNVYVSDDSGGVKESENMNTMIYMRAIMPRMKIQVIIYDENNNKDNVQERECSPAFFPWREFC